MRVAPGVPPGGVQAAPGSGSAARGQLPREPVRAGPGPAAAAGGRELLGAARFSSPAFASEETRTAACGNCRFGAGF